MGRLMKGFVAVLVVAGAVILVTTLTSSGGLPHRTTATTLGPVAPRSTTTTTAPPAPQPVWRVSWGSGMAWGYGTAANATARELATVGAGGSAVRIRISNLFGNAPLDVGSATVGVSAGGPAVAAGSLHQLLFSGQPTVTVPMGGDVYSDPVDMAVAAGQTLAVSLFVSTPDQVTLHPCCTNIVSFASPNGSGNLTTSVTGAGLSVSSPWPRWVDAVDVLQATGQGSIVVVGDSITDGYNATTNWPTVLQQRIDQLPAAEQRAVVNEGITANALTSDVHTDEGTGGGPSGLARLANDALDQSGVSEVVLFLGTNDLWFGATAAEVIEGYQAAIAAAHKAGVRIVGVTLLPRSTSSEEYWSPAQQAALEQVDQWIMNSGAFDGVIDLAAAVGDTFDGACNPVAMYPPYDSGDHLHPNAAGQTAMANAVEPSVLQLPAMPTVAPLVPATPTPACNASALS